MKEGLTTWFVAMRVTWQGGVLVGTKGLWVQHPNSRPGRGWGPARALRLVQAKLGHVCFLFPNLTLPTGPLALSSSIDTFQVSH